MNESSTSSFLGYVNSTSSGGNSVYPVKEVYAFIIDDGQVKVPNYSTIRAIKEYDFSSSQKFDSVEDCLSYLND